MANKAQQIGETALSFARSPPVLAVLVDLFRSRLTSKPSYSYWKNLINPSIYLDPPYNDIMRDSEAHAVLDVLYDSLSYRAAQDDASTCRLHLCGEGLSGKSCLYAHLRSVLAESNGISDKKQSSKNMPDRLHDGMEDKDIDAWMKGKNRVEVDPGDPGRTKGIRISTVRSMKHNGTQFIIYDYGGQREFLINHGSFLSAPGSVYIIVLPLWNKKDNKKYDDEDIVNRYSFWLRFIHSVSRKSDERYSPGSSMPIITIINRFDNNSGCCMCGRTEDDMNTLINDLKKTFSHFHQHFTPVSLFGMSTTLTDRDVLQINCNARDGAEQVSDVLGHALKHLKQQPRTMYPVARLIRNDIDATTDWHLVMTHDEWMQRAILTVVNSYTKLNNMQHSELKSYLLNMLACEALESLLHSGAMLQISSHSQACYVTSPNKLTNRILGRILDKMAKEVSFTGKETEMMENIWKERQAIFDRIVVGSNLSGLMTIDILKSVGLAVPLSELPTDSDVTQATVKSDINHFYYVVHGLLSEDMPNEWCLPFNGATRILTRTFMLTNKNTDMFYPGYFAALFRQVISLETDFNVNMWRNGMDLRTSKGNESIYAVQINISPAGNIEDGFRVMIATNEKQVSDAASDYAVQAMQKIRDAVHRCHVSVVEYCETTLDEMGYMRMRADVVYMRMLASKNGDNRLYHQLYCGKIPSDNMHRILCQHRELLVQQYRTSIEEIIKNSDSNKHALNALLRQLFRHLEEKNIQAAQENEERIVSAVRNLLEYRSAEDRKIMADMVQDKLRTVQDAIHSSSVAIAQLQENIELRFTQIPSLHDISLLLKNIVSMNLEGLEKFNDGKYEQVAKDFAQMKTEIMRQIAELHAKSLHQNDSNFNDIKTSVQLVLSNLMSQFETLRTQIQESDDDELRSLQKLQSRLEAIEQSMQRVLTTEDAEKMLKNTVLAQLRDDISAMFYSFMSESNNYMQEIARNTLMSIETKLQSVETNLLHQGTENTALTQRAIEDFNTEMKNMRTVLEKIDLAHNNVTVELALESTKRSLESIVNEQLQQYISSNDTRYDQIHAMLMEHGRALRAIRTMQENVIYSATDMPLLWCVSEIKENMFNIEYHIQCVCCVCGKKVRGGLTEKKQHKMGYYELKVTKQWVSQALKCLKITLKVLEIIGRAFSLPVPAVSSFIDDMNAFGVSEEQIQQMKSALEAAESLNDRISVVNNTISSVMNAAGLPTANQANSGEVNVSSSPQTISLLYVAEIRNLLKVLGVDLPPRYCGLRPVKHSREGSLVWLCEKSSDENPDACKKKFEEFGKEGLIYYPVFE